MSSSHDVLSKQTAIRSLRRRLWRALQEEDVDTAMRAYKCTQKDLQEWLADEERQREVERMQHEMARLRQEKEKRDARPAALKKLGTLVKSTKALNGNNKSQRGRRRSSKHSDTVPVVEPQPLDSTTPLLQEEMNPSDMFCADDFKSPDDPYDDDTTNNEPPPKQHRRKAKKTRGPRFAGFWGRSKDELSDDEDENVDEETADFTTPLHEAARLGSPTLVRFFLELGGIPNVKNGQSRTALHMVAGGVTTEEESLLVPWAAARVRGTRMTANDIINDDVGIRAFVVPQNEDDQETKEQEGSTAKKAAMVVKCLFQFGSEKNLVTDEPEPETTQDEPTSYSPPDVDRLNDLEAQRLDAGLAILSWFHPDDGSPNAGEGPSINSVDSRGRTALHYAAELGRSDVCTAVLSSFGSILTIVDESSQTPCELASERLHLGLAARLEARAVLYTDPYGVDDELMASVLADEERGHRRKLVPPFSWFETLDMEQVRFRRNESTQEAFVKMQEILYSRKEQNVANEVMLSYNVNDSLDSVPDVAVGVPDETTSEGTESGVAVGVGVPEEELQVSSEEEEEEEEEEDYDETAAEASSEPTSEHERNPSSAESDNTSETPDAQYDDATEDQVESVSLPVRDEVKNHNGNAAFELDSDDSEYTAMLDSLQESHVERFLAFHGWNVDYAIDEFRKDPMQSFDDAGVPVVVSKTLGKSEDGATHTCLICFDEFGPESAEWVDLKRCDHGFCEECLSNYISDCARSKTGGITVICPHHQCNAPVSQRELEALAPLMYGTLLDAADENFVTSCTDLRFCPHPGCTGVVRRLVPMIIKDEGYDLNIIDTAGAVCTTFPEGEACEGAPLTYEGVRDGRYFMSRGAMLPHRAHRFCFGCGDETFHWPITCEKLEEWKMKVEEEVQKVESEVEGENFTRCQDISQKLWLQANTRPCPKCKAPIEKNEGCNHMTCSNRQCKHEFCWICRGDWKLHNTQTGGFYRCNRWEGDETHEYYDDPPPPRRPGSEDEEDDNAEETDNGYGTAVHSSRVAHKKSGEMNRFLHYYQRWNAHKESLRLERLISSTVCRRMAPVVEAAIEFNRSDDFNFGGKGLSFVHAAFTELFECRSFLQHSYAFSYYRYPTLFFIRRNRVVKIRQKEKAAFEQFQLDLGVITEQISDVVGRKHLRATQTQIMFLTAEAAEKRRDFSNFIMSILDDERKQANAEREGSDDVAARRSIPPPIDIAGMIDRLNSRAPIINEHDAMGSDDEDGVNYPHRSFRRDLEEEAALQEALQASLQDFVVASESSGATSFGDDGEGPFAEWSCEACTYLNTTGRTCAMCGTAKES